MKKIATLLIIFLSFSQIFAQEYLLDYTSPSDTTDTDTSIFNGLIVNKENGAYLYLEGAQFNDANKYRSIDGFNHSFQSVATYNAEIFNLDNKRKVTFPYKVEAFKKYQENKFISVGYLDTKQPIVGSNYQGFQECKKLIVAVVDTVTEDSISYVSSDCDFRNLLAISFQNNHHYILYRNSSNTTTYIKLNSSLEFVGKVTLNEYIWQAKPSIDGGFTVFLIEESDPYRYQLSNLSLTGDLNPITNDLFFPEVEKRSNPDFLYDGTNIYLYLNSFDISDNQIIKYDLEGNELGTIESPYILTDWSLIDGGLIVFSQSINRSNSSPLNIKAIDDNFEIINQVDIGVSTLIVADVDIDQTSDEYLVLGVTDNHFNDPDIEVREHNKLYLAFGSISTLFTPATDSETKGFYFPNPNDNNYVFLKLKNKNFLNETNNLSIRFIDMAGKQFLTDYKMVSNELIRVDVTSLPKGVYIGNVYQNNKLFLSSKLVVND